MRSEGAGNKVLLIVILCGALGLFLYIRPRLFKPARQPQLMDRLVESEILGRFQVLDMATEMRPMLFYHKLSFRDVVTPEFLLSQGKTFGINLQKPGYVFSSESGEWGVYLSVIDSSRIRPGFKRLEEFLTVRDTNIEQLRLHFLPEQQIYVYYDHDYIFLYHGKHVRYRMMRTAYAQKNDMSDSWKHFLSLQTYKDEPLVVFSNSKRLKKLGLEYGLFSYDSDSLSFKLKTYIKSGYPLYLSLKDSGIGIAERPGMEKLLNLHLNLTQFKKHPEAPLYRMAVETGKKIAFPTDLFFKAWEGDLSLQEGGIHMVREEVVEMEYDEEFNEKMVRSYRLVPVPGYGVFLTVNDRNKSLINALFAKGIMTKQNNRFHFLLSPPLQLNIQKHYVQVFSADASPKIGPVGGCNGIWNYKGTKFAFRIDSLKNKEVFGSMEFPVSRLVRRGKFF